MFIINIIFLALKGPGLQHFSVISIRINLFRSTKGRVGELHSRAFRVSHSLIRISVLRLGWGHRGHLIQSTEEETN